MANETNKETYYKLIPEIGKHLADSQNTVGAKRGVYLDDLTNKPSGAGEFIPVTIESSDSASISPAAIAAIGTLCIAAGYGIAKAAPHVKRWITDKFTPWIADSVAPWFKQKWRALRGIKKQSQKTNELPVCAEMGVINSIETEDVEGTDSQPCETITLAEAQKELIDAYVLTITGYNKAQRVAKANVILPSGEVIDSKSLLLNQTVINQINSIFSNNPELLSKQQHRELSEILGYDVFQQGAFIPLTIKAVAEGIEETSTTIMIKY